MSNLGPKQDLGYFFVPASKKYLFGYARLEITLRPKPTGRHFDPDYVLVPVFSEEGGLQTLKISNPWHSPNPYRVFPGRIILRDRVGKDTEAYSLGGSLRVESSSELTSLIISSSAPIFYLIGEKSPAETLVEEIEILLAELRAQWAYRRDQLNRKLAALDPGALYMACLVSLDHRLKDLQAKEGEPAHSLSLLVQAELRFYTANGNASPLKALPEIL